MTSLYRKLSDKQWIGFVLVLAVMVRAPNLGRASLWFDEAISYLAATLPLSGITSNLVQSSHPPLYYLLLHLWMAVTPDSDAALRLLGLLWNLLLIPAVYWLATLFFHRRKIALLTAVLIAVSPFHILYSHELRMYTQLMTLVVLGTAAYWQARQTMKMAWWVAAGVIWTLAVYTHLFAFLALAAIGLYALWQRRHRRAFWRTVILIAIVTILFVPWLIILLGESEAGLGSMRPLAQPRPREWLKPLLAPAFLIFGLSDSLPYTAVALFLTLALIAIFALELLGNKGKSVPREVGFLLLMIACTVGVPVTLHLARPFFLPERTMAAASPFLFLLLGWGATRAGSPLPYLVYGTAVAMVAGLLLYHAGGMVKPPYREATAILQEEWQAGDLILHTSDGSYLPALRYLDKPQQILLAGDPDPRKPEFVYEALGGAVWSRERAIERAERLWLVVALEHSVEWQQEQVRQFEQKQALQARYDVNGIIILLYEPASSATVE